MQPILDRAEASYELVGNRQRKIHEQCPERCGSSDLIVSEPSTKRDAADRNRPVADQSGEDSESLLGDP